MANGNCVPCSVMAALMSVEEVWLIAILALGMHPGGPGDSSRATAPPPASDARTPDAPCSRR